MIFVSVDTYSPAALRLQDIKGIVSPPAVLISIRSPQLLESAISEVQGNSRTMNFDDLREFLESKMRMSHIYQPLLIKSLIESGGSATLRQLAGAFLSQDESQLLYYEKRLKEMPIKVLFRYEIIRKDGEFVSLNTGKLTLQQREEIKKLFEQKMQEYVVSRGLSIWDYRLII